MKLKEHFSNKEIQAFGKRSNAHAWFTVAVNWCMIVLAFAIPALWLNPLTLVLSLIILAGRQLGLAVLMHECGHGTLFESKALNQNVGQWLCAAPVLYRMNDYMRNHLNHHGKAGSIDDPDLSRYQNYPVSPAALRRKIFRDLTGRTTVNFFRKSFSANGITTVDDKGNKRFDAKQFVIKMQASIITNLLMIAALTWFGVPALYLLWIASYFSVYMVFSRIRNLAEHAVVPDLFDPNPILHTRTTVASWWERLTLAPNCVNYHLEHHLLPSVPKYRLSAFHEALKSKGLLAHADVIVGYPNLVRKLVAPPQSA